MPLILFLLIVIFVPGLVNADSTRTYNLEPIEVRGERLFLFRDDLPAATTIITSEQMESLPAKSVADVLNSAAGVYVHNYGGSGAQLVSIRGSASDHVLVLVDGQKVNSTRSGSVDVSEIPLSEIAEVQVLRSGASAEWGVEGFGGIVNLITKTAKEKRLTNLIVKTGTFILQDVAISHQQQFGPADTRFSLGLTNGNNDFSYLYSEKDTTYRIENSDFLTRNVNLKIGFNLISAAEGRIEFQASAFDADRGSPGTVEFTSPEARANEEILSAGLKSEWIDLLPTSFPTKSAFQLKGSRQISHYKKTPAARKFRHKNQRWQWAASQHFQFSSHLLTKIGWNGQHDNLKSTTDGSVKRTTNAIFAESIIQWKKLKFVSAVRGDFSSDYDSQWSPQGGVHLALVPARLMARGTLARAVKLPNFDDLFWTQTGQAKGNPNLKPERAINADVGIIFYPRHHFRLEAALFRNKIDDWIQWANSGGNVWQPSNIAKAEIRGIETEANLQISLSSHYLLYLAGNYSYLEPRNRSAESNTNDKILIRRPQHLAYGQIQFFNKKWTITIDWRYVSKRPLDGANFHWLDSYQLYNGKIETEITKFLRSGISCRNIGNKNYADFQYVPMPGREWILDVRFQF